MFFSNMSEQDKFTNSILRKIEICFFSLMMHILIIMSKPWACINTYLDLYVSNLITQLGPQYFASLRTHYSYISQ